eukprot:1003800_1
MKRSRFLSSKVQAIRPTAQVYTNPRISNESKYIQSALLKQLVDKKKNNEALEMYDDIMHQCATNTDHNFKDICHNLAIKACTNSTNYTKGREIHHSLQREGNNNVRIKHSLIHLYGLCSDMDAALNVFNSIALDERDTVSINAMMNAFIQNNASDKALHLYHITTRIKKSQRTHVLAIKACTATNAYDDGKRIIDKLQLQPMKHSIQLSNVLMKFYGHFNDLSNAMNAFNAIDAPQMDKIAFVTMMRLHYDHKQFTQMLLLYDKYPQMCDDMIHLMALKACTNINDLRKAKAIVSQLKLSAKSEIQLCNKVIDVSGLLHDV